MPGSRTPPGRVRTGRLAQAVQLDAQQQARHGRPPEEVRRPAGPCSSSLREPMMEGPLSSRPYGSTHGTISPRYGTAGTSFMLTSQ